MANLVNIYIVDNEIIPINKFDIKALGKGVSIYEVVKLINGTALFLDDHIKRLHTSAKIKGKSIWIDDETIKMNIYSLINNNKALNGRLKFALRFHESGNKLITFFLDDIEPKKEVYKTGVSIISKIHERINPNAKVINYDLRKKLKELIAKEKAFETLLLNNFGKVTECSRSNIFFIKDNTVYTSKSKDVLIGITRCYVFDICKKNNIKIVESDILYESVKSFESVFISGTSIGILAVNKIDSFNFSTDNTVLKTISDHYNSIVRNYIENYSAKK